MVKGKDTLIAILGFNLQLRLQHLQNLSHILCFAVQRDHLDMLPRIRFRLVVFQHVEERIGAALTLKISGGNCGRIVLCGQIVDLLQMIDAIFLAGSDLSRISRYARRHIGGGDQRRCRIGVLLGFRGQHRATRAAQRQCHAQ